MLDWKSDISFSRERRSFTRRPNSIHSKGFAWGLFFSPACCWPSPWPSCWRRSSSCSAPSTSGQIYYTHCGRTITIYQLVGGGAQWAEQLVIMWAVIWGFSFGLWSEAVLSVGIVYFLLAKPLAIVSNQENKIFTYNLFSMKHIQMLVEYEIAAQSAKKCTK